MRPRTRRVAMAALVALAGSVVCLAQSPDPRLTVADVELVTGRVGIRVAPSPLAGADRLNFADRDGAVLFVVDFFSDADYQRARTMIAQTPSAMIANLHSGVTGIGDEAFDAPGKGPRIALYVRKGAKAFRLLSMLTDPATSSGKSPRVPQTQLRRLAQIVASRI